MERVTQSLNPMLHTQNHTLAQHAEAEPTMRQVEPRRSAPRFLQRYMGNNGMQEALVAPSNAVPLIVHDVLRSPGRPLDDDTRAFMEPRFGQDFSKVRVHTDSLAAESAQGLGALAYTVGSEIVFRPGQYFPSNQQGARLLAHELAHVVQNADHPTGKLSRSSKKNKWESQAEQAGTSIMNRSISGVTPDAPPALRMSPDPKLTEILEQIQYLHTTIPIMLAPKLKANRIFEVISAVNLSNPDNLHPIVLTILNTFNDPDGGVVVNHILDRIPSLQNKGQPAKIEEESPGALETIGGGFLGEFNEDPTIAMIGVDTVVSLIPILDQVSDVRDLGAHLYFMTAKDEYKKPLRWLGLIFSLIGLFPEIGSAIKSVSKLVIKKAVEYADEILAAVRHFIPSLDELTSFWHRVQQDWHNIVAFGILVWKSVTQRVAEVLGRIPTALSEHIRKFVEALARVREQSAAKLTEGFNKVRSMLDDLASHFMQPVAEGAGVVPDALLSHSTELEQKAVRTTPTKVKDLHPSATPSLTATSVATPKPTSVTSHHTGPQNVEEWEQIHGPIKTEKLSEIPDEPHIIEPTQQHLPKGIGSEDIEHLLQYSAAELFSRFQTRLDTDQMHHAFFRYLLRAISKARGVRGIPRHGRKIPLELNIHETIHIMFDDSFPELARRLNASNEIAQSIQRGEITPSEIADLLIEFYRDVSSNFPNLLPPQVLDRIETVILSIRVRGEI